jgi:hypothetical protein
MTPGEIKALVEDQVDGRWDESNEHGVNLRESLVEPKLIPLIFRCVMDGKIKDRQIESWLVLEEKPRSRDGYKIVYSETESCFGLASEGFPEDPHLVLTGWYGDFWTTFEGM